MGRLIIFGFIMRITGVVMGRLIILVSILRITGVEMGRLIVLVVSILEFIFVVEIYRDLSD